MTDSRAASNGYDVSCPKGADGVEDATYAEAPRCRGDASSMRDVESPLGIDGASGVKDGSSLDVVSASLPALEQALAISEVAVAQGFEWGSVEGVWAKVAEEIGEFKEASDPADKELEFGDVLFSLVNIARWEGIDPEQALLATCRKFRWRWGRMEQVVQSQGKTLSDLTTEELLQSWKRAKQDEKKMGINYV